MKNMNDHYVRDEADDWLEYRIGQQQRHRFLTNSRNYKTMRRSCNNAFSGMTKLVNTQIFVLE